MRELRSLTHKDIAGVKYPEKFSFDGGLLPLEKDVLQLMVFHMSPSRAGKNMMTKEEAAGLVADGLIDHWVWCNVYTIRHDNVKRKILKLWKEFMYLVRTRPKQKTDNWKVAKADPFNDRVAKTLFDILVKDKVRRKKLEEFYRVKMSEVEEEFVQDQNSERKMFCDKMVERKWLKMANRRKKREQGLQKMFDREEQEELLLKPTSLTDKEWADMGVEDAAGSQDEENDDGKDYEEEGAHKKRRRTFVGVTGDNTEDALPPQYRHIRLGERKVKPKYYRVVDKLVSKYHMSLSQATAAVVEVGNYLFDRKWKYQDTDKEAFDLDTVPDKSVNRAVGKALEAFTLAQIAEKIISSDQSVTITYHDDGSKKQGAGSYSVQGASINGQFFPFPTINISSETRQNLAELKLTMLTILAVCGGVTKEALWEKIDFVMTDSVSHNMMVEDIVSEALDVEHTPEHLLCQVHPSLMFNRVLTKLWSEVDATIGPDKIFAGFCLTINTEQVSVTENWLDCVLRLVSHDFDHKQWNKAEEFDLFIHPEKNAAKRLQKERFNSLAYSCVVALNLDENVCKFLLKYENITNQLACICRSFESLEYIRVMAAVGAVIGIHLIEPFVSLTSSSTTTYSKLITSFPQLYTDLTTTPSRLLLDLSTPAFKFISKERFESVKYPDTLLRGTKQVLEQYNDKVVSVLDILLPRLASGWELQRGNMFQFGKSPDPNANNQIANFNKEKLDKAPVNNLDPERAVGFINYELKLRGAKELAAASRAHVKGKGVALIEGKEMPAKFKKLTVAGGDLPLIMKEWEAKQLELKKEGMGDKEIQNLAVDKRRNSDLSVLTKAGGPFTKAEQVDMFMEQVMEEKERNQRLYVEVRYARDSSVAFPKSSDIFRLKKNYKNMESSIYAANLKAYLNKLVCHVNMDIGDFMEAVKKISKS